MAKVLLVEDDNNLREIYQARLMAEGYDISAAQNGEEALVVAKQSKPDLIISDVMMPRISGFEMLDILRNTDELKHTKVIMLTALGQAEDQKRANNLGADRYLVKSQVTLEDIVNAAKELLIEDGAITDVPPPPAAVEPTATAGQPAPAVAATAAPVAPAAPEPTTTPAPVTPQPATAAAVPPAPANPTPATTVATVPVASEPPTAPVEQVVTPAQTSSPALTPMPTPPPAPVAEPTAAPSASVDAATVTPTVIDPAVSAATAVTDAATQTLEAEEAALQSQINTYAQEPAVTPVAAEPSETPATDVEASNAQAITNAVQELNAATPAEPVQPPSVANAPMPEPPAPATPVEQAVPPATSSPALTPMPTPPPAPVAPATPAAPASTPVAEPAPAPAIQVPTPAATDSNVTIGGKKIIQPISDPASRPDLNALLAKEEAKESTPVAPPVTGGTPAQAQPMPPHTPGQSFDPNTAL